MANSPGAQQNPTYCMLAGALNVSFDNGATWTPIGGGSGGTITTSAPLSGNGSVGTPATIAAGAIALTKLATQAQATVVGNASGSGTVSPTALTATQLTALLNAATSSLPGAMTAAQFTQLTYLAARWENAQEGFLSSKISNLNYEYIKIPYTIYGAKSPLGIGTGDASVQGAAMTGGATSGAGAYNQLTGVLYTTPKTTNFAFSFYGNFPVPSGSNNKQAGFTNVAGSHGIDLVSKLSIDATHLVLQLNGASTTNAATTHVIDGNPHTYSVTWDATTVTVWVDGVSVLAQTTVTNLVDDSLVFYVYSTEAGAFYVSKLLYGY